MMASINLRADPVRMLLIFDDRYMIEVYSGAGLSTSCSQEIKTDDQDRISLTVNKQNVYHAL